MERSFIRSTDARELLDLSFSSLFIETFDIPLFTNLKRCIYKDLDKIRCSNDLFDLFPVTLFRGNKGSQSNDTGVCHELGHLRDTPNVLLSVLRRKTQVLVQARADIITIQAVTVQSLPK